MASLQRYLDIPESDMSHKLGKWALLEVLFQLLWATQMFEKKPPDILCVELHSDQIKSYWKMCVCVCVCIV